MDSYPSLLSPIDNFAFSQFANSPVGGSPAPRGKPTSRSLQQDVPRTPLPKTNNEWQELLDSSQSGQFPFNMWEDSPFTSDKQSSGSPWRPHVYRAISDSFLDSPLSSSSFLSSTSGSPSVVSSTTCSPWQTCPGLAPVNPDIPLLDELSLGLQGSFSVSSDDVTAYGFNNLSLGSPITLSHDLDNGAIEPFSLMDTHSHTTTTVEPSHLMTNALGLDLTAQNNSNAVMMSSDPTQIFAPFSQTVSSPPHSKGSSPLSDPSDVPPSPPHSVPSYTSGASFDPFPTSSGIPSDSAMQDRASRRRTSRVDYAEDAYDGDSDDDLDESSGAGANLVRIAKRRKASSESPSFMYSGSDEDAELSEFGTRRGKKGGRRAASKGANGNASNARRKSKRRHHCPLEGCKQTFTRVTDMARHLASVHRTHDTDANRCSFCHKAFSRDDAVLRHENDSCPMRPRKNNNRNELWS
ncbi:hypothetical protein ACEPAI_8796 [Sanghuangporus weigelae]